MMDERAIWESWEIWNVTFILGIFIMIYGPF